MEHNSQGKYSGNESLDAENLLEDFCHKVLCHQLPEIEELILRHDWIDRAWRSAAILGVTSSAFPTHI